MAMNVSVPVQLLKEFKDRKVTVEANNGVIFTGLVHDVEDNLSLSLDSVKAISIDGKVTKMEGIYIRGSRIRVINLPDSAADYLPRLTRPPARGRGGFRGGRRGSSRGESRPPFRR